AQPLDDLSCLFELTHMRIAGGEVAIRQRGAWIILNREKKFRRCGRKAPAEEMGGAYKQERRADAGARAEAQRGFEMLNCKVALTRQNPEIAADVPAAREARIEHQSTLDQRDHCADVLAEPSQCEGGIHQDARVVAGHLQGSPCEIGALPTVRRRVFT